MYMTVIETNSRDKGNSHNLNYKQRYFQSHDMSRESNFPNMMKITVNRKNSNDTVHDFYNISFGFKDVALINKGFTRAVL